MSRLRCNCCFNNWLLLNYGSLFEVAEIVIFFLLWCGSNNWLLEVSKGIIYVYLLSGICLFEIPEPSVIIHTFKVSKSGVLLNLLLWLEALCLNCLLIEITEASISLKIAKSIVFLNLFNWWLFKCLNFYHWHFRLLGRRFHFACDFS